MAAMDGEPEDPSAGPAAEDGAELQVELHRGMESIPAADWDACAAPERADGGRPLQPFLTHAWLAAFEESGSATPETGWAPHHLVARIDGRAVAAMPLYLKGHSQGEYVFDHSWAHAFHHAGGDYYPKLQSAVPFTPATGPRLLVRPDAPVAADSLRGALLQAAVEIAEASELSSLHVTFCTEAEWRLGGRLGLLQRTDQQFHWENRGYGSFEGFLADLASRKRKAVRKERARATENGVTIHWLTGDDIRPEHWDAFWRFYQDTGSRKWGTPYLTRAFFEIAQARLRDDILLVFCAREGRWIAGAMNVIGREVLFGRYWGCTEHHPCLHFETCYYQAIDFAIAEGLARVEAGAQGDHKLARGYAPVTTHSLHHLTHPGLQAAVRRYLKGERQAVAEESAALARMTPFRKGD
ncbi:GNAT family N-acetyltransferase [Paralimibaculum aggregatum]|uniref:GNAT family N-acetyltransferase n=1 Tax=Paralimibaculum aggregatum TaxID=3036245 RepID=A0ABQ6LFU0_9RHOB|nr:GNAT family N-acetyltransferase [Limibaculum sp. NKW23]GMG81065.1 GNAT family N-acetyltransferase [Limibaculum sp. NKW23]